MIKDAGGPLHDDQGENRAKRLRQECHELPRHDKEYPSEYLRRFYYDTRVYDPLVLRALIERIGADRLILSSDFPVGENDAVGFISALPDLSRREFDQITKQNAASVLQT